MKTTTLSTNCIHRSLGRYAFFSLLISCVAIPPMVQAIVPPPDGGYPNFTTAEGTNALLNLTSGAANTGLGWSSLLNVTTGSFNTGVGAGTLVLTTGDSNTATGAAALLLNTTGTQNTAVGTAALLYNDTGNRNTANGAFALMSNTTGNNNTAIGRDALVKNTIGSGNTAIGHFAGSSIDGNGNVCIGIGVVGEGGVDDSTYISNVNTTEQSPDEGVAFVTVRLSDSRLGHQPIVMRSASSELQKTVEVLQATVAQLTQQLKEQAAQIQKVSAKFATASPSLADLN
jgi:hypothetical protein